MRVQFNKTTGSGYFKLEQLGFSTQLTGFASSVGEYNEYLTEDALRSQKDHVALTWLLRDNAEGKIAAYMTLIMVSLRSTKKNGFLLNIELYNNNRKGEVSNEL
jgi:hypothetical protein